VSGIPRAGATAEYKEEPEFLTAKYDDAAEGKRGGMLVPDFTRPPVRTSVKPSDF